MGFGVSYAQAQSIPETLFSLHFELIFEDSRIPVPLDSVVVKEIVPKEENDIYLGEKVQPVDDLGWEIEGNTISLHFTATTRERMLYIYPVAPGKLPLHFFQFEFSAQQWMGSADTIQTIEFQPICLQPVFQNPHKWEPGRRGIYLGPEPTTPFLWDSLKIDQFAQFLKACPNVIFNFTRLKTPVLSNLIYAKKSKREARKWDKQARAKLDEIIAELITLGVSERQIVIHDLSGIPPEKWAERSLKIPTAEMGDLKGFMFFTTFSAVQDFR